MQDPIGPLRAFRALCKNKKKHHMQVEVGMCDVVDIRCCLRRVTAGLAFVSQLDLAASAGTRHSTQALQGPIDH